MQIDLQLLVEYLCIGDSLGYKRFWKSVFHQCCLPCLQRSLVLLVEVEYLAIVMKPDENQYQLLVCLWVVFKRLPSYLLDDFQMVFDKPGMMNEAGIL